MAHTIAHDLSFDLAKKVADKAFETYKAKFAEYNPALSWATPSKANISFVAKGITLKGYIEVKEKQIELDLDVPFLFRPFKGKAIEVIEKEVKEWVGKAKAGQI